MYVLKFFRKEKTLKNLTTKRENFLTYLQNQIFDEDLCGHTCSCAKFEKKISTTYINFNKIQTKNKQNQPNYLDDEITQH